MIILPAIDIKDGQCVRLVRGDFNTAHQVAENALETAKSFKEAGAEYLHIVDLDGALHGKQINRDMIIELARHSGLFTEVGGGIRDLRTVEDYLNNGVNRVIIGSAALKDPEFVRRAVGLYGERIAVGIDARNEYVSTVGWTEDSQTHYIDFAREMSAMGVKTIIFTDISKDGTLEGPNFEQLGRLISEYKHNIIASGGIRDINHIKALSEMRVYGAICGKSIYDGTLNLKEALLISFCESV